MNDRGAQDTQRAYARLAGLMYLLVLAFDIAGIAVTARIAGGGGFAEASQHIAASETLYRLGLCLSLAGSLATIPLAIGLHAVLRPVDANLALMALLFRAAEATLGGAGAVAAFSVLQVHLAATHAGALSAGQLGELAGLRAGGTEVAAIFFSVGSTIFFAVFARSRYIPGVMAWWGVLASLVYAAAWLVSLVAPQAPVVGPASAPILAAELATALWLLVAGIRIPPPPEALPRSRP
jgi:hypothetical protein